MSEPIRTVVALGPGAGRDLVEAAFLAEPGISLTEFVTAQPGDVLRLGTDHEALVVVCVDDDEAVLGFISEAVGDRPDRPVVVVHEGSMNGFVGRAFQAGAEDLLETPVGGGAGLDGGLARDVRFALEKALARRDGTVSRQAQERTAQQEGELIAILGPKGGTGKTLTSCNLSAALAREGRKVVLIDLDLQFGDVGLAFGLSPQRTIYDLAVSGGSLDAQKVEDFLTVHDESGLHVLLAPSRPDHAAAVTPDFLRELFGTLRETFDILVVDTPPTFTPEVIAAIDCSSQICMVSMLDALSLKNAKLALETLQLMGYDPSRVRLLLNRADSRVGISNDDVVKILGRSPDVLVPSHRDITRSINEAKPIVLTRGNADARRAFEGLASLYTGADGFDQSPQSAERSPRRWFRRVRNEA